MNLLRKHPRRPHSTVIQEHHIEYKPPWVVKVYKGEHYILGLFQSRIKRDDPISIGFLTALNHLIESVKGSAVEL